MSQQHDNSRSNPKSKGNSLRQAPQNLDAERCLLASLICKPGDHGAALSLSTSNFFLHAHRLIFNAIRKLASAGKKLDIIAVMDELGENVESAGGAEYLGNLLNGMYVGPDLENCIRIIREKAQLRELASLGELAWTANRNAGELFERVKSFSAHIGKEVGQKRILGFKTGEELEASLAETVPWIVNGLIAKAGITELGAKVKAGKTTLILAMIRAILDGTPFLGFPTHQAPVVYLTEQPMVSFRQAMERAGLLGRKDFIVLPFTETCGIPWPDVALSAAKKCQDVGAELMVVDTLPQFAGLTGERENNSGDALEAMLPLQQAAAQGTGIGIVRHERKSGGDVGDSGRGSSAFAGAVDIVLSLRKLEGNSAKTRRLLQSVSRFSETPSDIVIDLQDGNYVNLGQQGDTATMDAKGVILANTPETELEAADLKELLEGTKVSRQTAQRAIDELLREGMLRRIGKGKRGDPFRYFLTENRFCPTPNIYGQKEMNREKEPGGNDAEVHL